MPVGDDAFTAQLLSDVCTDEGVRHELILGSDHRALLSRDALHRLVVHYDDLPEVERIIGDHRPGLLVDPIERWEPTRSSVSRRMRLLVGVPLLAVFLAGIIVGAIGLISLLV